MPTSTVGPSVDSKPSKSQEEKHEDPVDSEPPQSRAKVEIDNAEEVGPRHHPELSHHTQSPIAPNDDTKTKTLMITLEKLVKLMKKETC